ncbi:MAG: SRPBCC family protein [Thermoleophilaceae bacterium]|nr:SRPBCC family protein [Thermoleophilaceae bacterium]
MRLHLLERSQRLSRPPDDVFPFFADALNLERITPPWLGLSVLTPEPIDMRAGTLIDYRLELHGIALSWHTEIALWEPPRRFVDVQLSGPYRVWHHTHTFSPDGDGTVMRDVVRYGLPLGPLGELARVVLVRRDLEDIFDFRQREVARILGA